jgi:hypothetical protein
MPEIRFSFGLCPGGEKAKRGTFVEFSIAGSVQFFVYRF